MPKENKTTDIINAQGVEIAILSLPNTDDYISLTDIAKFRNKEEPNVVVAYWIRNKTTIEYLGLWEMLNNPNFKPLEFEGFKNEAGGNAFTLSPSKWIKSTNAIGLKSSSGRYGGGTYAHKDIAFEFASWLSPEFKLYIIKDYQRLKEDENHKSALDWDVKRILSKTNYRIHTDAIKENLIPPELSKKEESLIYANEADLLNVALFGKQAWQWRNENPHKTGNIRDEATIEQLIVLINLQNASAMFIEQGFSQQERLVKLRQMAIDQMKQIIGLKSVDDLKNINNQTRIKLLDSEM